MDRIEAMSILVAAVETGSFTAAARKLGTSLPTVSRKVAELEAHLNARLLIRSTRSLTLTDAGDAYVAACRRILEHVGDAERAASGEYRAPRGDLVITAPVVFGRLHVLPVVTEFLAAFPEVNVRLALSDRNVHLIDDHVDVAVRIGALPDSGLVAIRVGTVRHIVCGSPAYFASHWVPSEPAELSAMACVSFEGIAPTSSWGFADRNSRTLKPVAISPRLSVNTAEAALDAAIAGLGLTRVLSYQAARAVADGTLLVVLADFEPDPLPIHLVHAGQGIAPLKLRAFLDFAAPRVRDRVAAAELAQK